MPVDTYEVALLDPFGQVICSMTYSSFAPEDDAMNWFAPLLNNGNEAGDGNEVHLTLAPMSSAPHFSVRITRK